MDVKEGRPASRSSRMSPSSSHLRRVSFAADPCVADDGPPQPQTATCCTALQRGFAPDSRVQPRYAPVRTPGSAALLRVDEGEEDQQPQSAKDAGGGGASVGGEETMVGASAPAVVPAKEGSVTRKALRKWKSTVEDVDVSSQLAETPRLRRSGGMRRDWSFENLRGGNNAA